MDKELRLLLPLFSGLRETVIDGVEFHLGDVGGHSVVAMKSGIGKVNAALSAAAMIRQFAPEVVINTGVAGGTGEGASVLDVVVATEIAYHDVWCGPGTVEGQAAGCPRFFKPEECFVSLPCLENDPKVKFGLIASGDVFVSDPAVVARIKSLYPSVMAVDMESAAIAHACHLMSTPFFCLRVVSDTPGEHDNASQYDNFWEAAPRQTFDVISRVLSAIAVDNEDDGNE